MLIEKPRSMQFDPIPAVPEQPPVIVPLPEPPIAPLAVKVKVLPTCPAPLTVDCVGAADTETI